VRGIELDPTDPTDPTDPKVSQPSTTRYDEQSKLQLILKIWKGCKLESSYLPWRGLEACPVMSNHARMPRELVRSPTVHQLSLS